MDSWHGPTVYWSRWPGHFRWLQSYWYVCIEVLSDATCWVCAIPDTAQSYRNEYEAGIAIKESGLARKDLYITTKFSGRDGLDIPTSINNSLKNVRLFLPNLFNNLIMRYSLESSMSISISSTTLVSPLRIFQLHGSKWKSWRQMVSPSPYLFRPSLMINYSLQRLTSQEHWCQQLRNSGSQDPSRFSQDKTGS